MGSSSASDPVDFRKGHDGLAALVQSKRCAVYNASASWVFLLRPFKGRKFQFAMARIQGGKVKIVTSLRLSTGIGTMRFSLAKPASKPNFKLNVKGFYEVQIRG